MGRLQTMRNQYVVGDCKDTLTSVPDNSIDLIITSPPYADSRKGTYGGIHPDKYVEWFLPRSKEFFRVLKPTGTFIPNIKEKVVDGERHTYVMDLIREMKGQGWMWTEEFVWHKKNCHPGKWPNRFRDAWERCLQFNKSKRFHMYQENVMVPIGDWSKSRLAHLSNRDKIRDPSSVGSGFGKNISNWLGRTRVYPDNVLHLSTECGNKNHSAVFPVSLPAWFIKLFTKEGDVVLDPFAGSGTTGVACTSLGRDYLLIDVVQRYKTYAKKRIHHETSKTEGCSGLHPTQHRGLSRKSAEKPGKHQSTLVAQEEEPVLVQG